MLVWSPICSPGHLCKGCSMHNGRCGDPPRLSELHQVHSSFERSTSAPPSPDHPCMAYLHPLTPDQPPQSTQICQSHGWSHPSEAFLGAGGDVVAVWHPSEKAKKASEILGAYFSFFLGRSWLECPHFFLRQFTALRASREHRGLQFVQRATAGEFGFQSCSDFDGQKPQILNIP